MGRTFVLLSDQLGDGSLVYSFYPTGEPNFVVDVFVPNPAYDASPAGDTDAYAVPRYEVTGTPADEDPLYLRWDDVQFDFVDDGGTWKVTVSDLSKRGLQVDVGKGARADMSTDDKRRVRQSRRRRQSYVEIERRDGTKFGGFVHFHVNEGAEDCPTDCSSLGDYIKLEVFDCDSSQCPNAQFTADLDTLLPSGVQTAYVAMVRTGCVYTGIEGGLRATLEIGRASCRERV